MSRAKLATRLGIQTSRQTILRRVMDLPDVLPTSILSLGIDDFSFRRGYRFGTTLVDLVPGESPCRGAGNADEASSASLGG